MSLSKQEASRLLHHRIMDMLSGADKEYILRQHKTLSEALGLNVGIYH